MPDLPTIVVYTHTSLIPATLIEAWTTAAQIALDQDFAPRWSGATLRYAAPGSLILPNEWQFVIFDHTDQAGALGYHDVTTTGQPILKCFAADCIADGANWNVTFSHELHEAIVDPQITRTAIVGDQEYAFETDDACEDDRFAVRVAGHLQSNSVTPAWFDPNGKPPYTIYPCAEITAPFMLASGGYIGRRQLPDGQWAQLFPEGDRTARQIKRPSSRTMRRFNA